MLYNSTKYPQSLQTDHGEDELYPISELYINDGAAINPNFNCSINIDSSISYKKNNNNKKGNKNKNQDKKNSNQINFDKKNIYKNLENDNSVNELPTDSYSYKFGIPPTFETDEESKGIEIPSQCGNLDISNIKNFSPVESSFNIQGNYQSYIFQVIRSLSPLAKIDFEPLIQERLVLLPEYNKKKTLILDLDETLIHADFDERFEKHHQRINFNYEDEIISVDIFIRPGAKEFLKKCSEIFEIFIFTASKKEYADAVINFLDPEKKIIKHRLYRDSCIPINNQTYIKDLRIFVNRKQENLVLVDNSFYSFCSQPKNGVLINSFYDDDKDQELFNLLNYLENYVYPAQDIRIINEQIFNFEELIQQCLKKY